MHEFGRPKILVSIEKFLPGQLALAVLVVAILIPGGIRRIGVFSQIIRRVGYNQLGVRDPINFEVLKMVVV